MYLAVVAQAFNSSTLETEASRIQGQHGIERVPGQPGLHRGSRPHKTVNK